MVVLRNYQRSTDARLWSGDRTGGSILQIANGQLGDYR